MPNAMHSANMCTPCHPASQCRFQSTQRSYYQVKSLHANQSPPLPINASHCPSGDAAKVSTCFSARPDEKILGIFMTFPVATSYE